MAELTIWKTEEMNRLRRDMGRMFARVWDDFGMEHSHPHAGGIDSIELIDRGPSLVLRAKTPDIDPQDLAVQVSEDRLTLQGTVRRNQVQDNDRSRSIQTRYGSFSRSMRLPCRVVPEEVEATFNDGVLEVMLPKRKTESAREIEIRIA
ncbi:MAG: Hsp20/alpha crystallin family protein [Thermodesulfobacteriota bacterium]